jgi:hypothetical protein
LGANTEAPFPAARVADLSDFLICISSGRAIRRTQLPPKNSELNMSRMKYASAAAFSALAVLAGPVAEAISAPPTAAVRAERPSVSAKATVGSVRAWQQFRIYGKTEHLRAGTRVTLQQLQGNDKTKHWVSLPASMTTNSTGGYNLRVKLGLLGRNSLRIVGGGAVSPVVYVNVHR